MKTRHLLYILLIIFVATTVFAGAIIIDFRGEAGVNRVTLKWIVKAESDVKGYEVYRSMDGITFQKLAFVEAQADESKEKTYTFVDKSVFKPTGNTFYYKIKYVETNNRAQEYDKVVVVSPQISSARHTWGSIKAMFR